MHTKGGQDLVAGLLFAAIGIAAYVIGADYQMGTPQKPGTGVLPRILAWCLIGCGGALMIKSVVGDLAGMAEAIWRPATVLVIALVLGGIVQWAWDVALPGTEGRQIIQIMIGLAALFFIADSFGLGVAWGPFAYATLATVMFGFLIDELGLVITMLATMFVAAQGTRDLRPREFGVFAAIMVVGAVGIFIKLLGMPIPTWPAKVPAWLKAIVH